MTCHLCQLVVAAAVVKGLAAFPARLLLLDLLEQRLRVGVEKWSREIFVSELGLRFVVRILLLDVTVRGRGRGGQGVCGGGVVNMGGFVMLIIGHDQIPDIFVGVSSVGRPVVRRSINRLNGLTYGNGNGGGFVGGGSKGSGRGRGRSYRRIGRFWGRGRHWSGSILNRLMVSVGRLICWLAIVKDFGLEIIIEITMQLYGTLASRKSASPFFCKPWKIKYKNKALHDSIQHREGAWESFVPSCL